LSTQQGLANVHAMARGKGVIAGVVASWVKALSEPPLQAAAEWTLPPSPAQKQEVGADPRTCLPRSSSAAPPRRSATEA
jgi:hypothetical protein